MIDKIKKSLIATTRGMVAAGKELVQEVSTSYKALNEIDNAEVEVTLKHNGESVHFVAKYADVKDLYVKHAAEIKFVFKDLSSNSAEPVQ
jgi:hypothetical protein